MADLLPCPFCGGEAIETLAGISCTKCPGTALVELDATQQEAIYAWNTRTFKAVYEDGNLCKIVTDTDTYKPERTCNNTNSPNTRNFICSECGESYPKAELTECPNYCPNCGAKVVEE